MSDRSDTALIGDIQLRLERIKKYISGLSYEDFIEDCKTQDAVIRNIEILGEASKKLSPQLISRHPEIPWRLIAGTRDRLIHGYFGVNIDIIWQVATVDLPVLEEQIRLVARELEG